MPDTKQKRSLNPWKECTISFIWHKIWPSFPFLCHPKQSKRAEQLWHGTFLSSQLCLLLLLWGLSGKLKVLTRAYVCTCIFSCCSLSLSLSLSGLVEAVSESDRVLCPLFFFFHLAPPPCSYRHGAANNKQSDRHRSGGPCCCLTGSPHSFFSSPLACPPVQWKQSNHLDLGRLID